MEKLLTLKETLGIEPGELLRGEKTLGILPRNIFRQDCMSKYIASRCHAPSQRGQAVVRSVTEIVQYVSFQVSLVLPPQTYRLSELLSLGLVFVRACHNLWPTANDPFSHPDPKACASLFYLGICHLVWKCSSSPKYLTQIFPRNLAMSNNLYLLTQGHCFMAD